MLGCADTINQRCFGRLSLKGVSFQVVNPANLDELPRCSDALKIFGKNIDHLTEKKSRDS